MKLPYTELVLGSLNEYELCSDITLHIIQVDCLMTLHVFSACIHVYVNHHFNQNFVSYILVDTHLFNTDIAV